MATRRKKKPRTFTHGHRQGLDLAAEHFLRECYRQKKPVRAKDFARSLDLTPEYVSWLAAKILGGSLHAFLRKKQVEHAARLLRRTPLSLEEIAARSGFGTRSTMHRWFVRRTGWVRQPFGGGGTVLKMRLTTSREMLKHLRDMLKHLRDMLKHLQEMLKHL